MVLFALFYGGKMEIVITLIIGLFTYAVIKVANEKDKDE